MGMVDDGCPADPEGAFSLVRWEFAEPPVPTELKLGAVGICRDEERNEAGSFRDASGPLDSVAAKPDGRSI